MRLGMRKSRQGNSPWGQTATADGAKERPKASNLGREEGEEGWKSVKEDGEERRDGDV